MTVRLFGRFFGTPVYAGLSSLLMVLLFGFWGAGFFGMAVGAVFGVAIGIGSLLLHERMHVTVGDRFGILCRGIVLLPFGAVSLLADTGRRPWELFAIAVIGPLTSAVLALGFGLGMGLIPESSFSLLRNIFLFGTVLNAGFAVFNALPMYPMDGGRMTHAIAWAVAGDERRGRVLAVNIARGTIFLLGAAGFVAVFLGLLSLFSFVWFGFIAWFLWRAGEEELQRL